MTATHLSVRHFQRPEPLLAPWFVWFAAAWIGVGGVSAIASGSYWWGAALSLAAALSVAQNRWERKTPIVSLSADEVVLRRSYLRPPKRIPISAIVDVDRSEPGDVRLALKDGSSERIPLAWLAWQDHSDFIAFLNVATQRAKA